MKSVKQLQESLAYVTRLKAEEDLLLPALEEGNSAKIEALVKSAEGVEIGIEEKSVNATEITVIGNVFQTSLNIARDLLITLNEELLSKERAIESLLPKKNYLWEKNFTLKERMATAVEVVANPQKGELKQTLENLPKFLSNVDECVATIVAYSERKELLLNYPTAQTAIENQLGDRQPSVSPEICPSNQDTRKSS